MLSIGTLNCHDLCWMGLTFNPLNYSKGHHSLAALCCGFVHSLSGLDWSTIADLRLTWKRKMISGKIWNTFYRTDRWTNEQTKICISWAPDGAKNLHIYLHVNFKSLLILLLTCGDAWLRDDNSWWQWMSVFVSWANLGLGSDQMDDNPAPECEHWKNMGHVYSTVCKVVVLCLCLAEDDILEA